MIRPLKQKFKRISAQFILNAEVSIWGGVFATEEKLLEVLWINSFCDIYRRDAVYETLNKENLQSLDISKGFLEP